MHYTIPFLDINISLKDGYLHTDIYTKPTDTHAYLHHKSCHPRHTVNNIPFSQFLRLRRICSETETFDARADEMTGHFVARGYARDRVEGAKLKVRGLARSDTLSYKAKRTNTRPPFVLTHNPRNPPLRQWFADLQTSVVPYSDRLQRVLPLPPVIGERNCKSLRNLLMPSNLPPVRDPSPGCFKCTKQCIVCTEHLVEGNSFRSQNTEEVFTIRDRVSCESENVIYLLYCQKNCKHSQYVGRTIKTLRSRFYVHRCHINKNTGTHVTRHFNLPNHSLSDMRCMVVEKVYSRDVSTVDKRESFWMQKLRTVYPNGLNTLE